MQDLIERWGLVAVFLGTLLEGEVVMILAGVVAHLGLIGLPAALATGALGGFVSDLAWFSAGRARAIWIRETRLYRRTEPVIAKVADRLGLWQVMFCRLVYGTRVPTMVLWGVRGLRATRFAAFALPGCVLWASIFGIAGFLLSDSAALIIGDVKHLQHWLLGAVVVAFVIILGLKFLARFQKRREALCLVAALALAAATDAAASAPSPVRVATSRGEFEVLVYAPPGGTAARDAQRPLVLLISGEGGWRSFDVLLAGWLSEAGYWVGGVDVKPYFEKAQDDRKALSQDIRAYADRLAEAAGAGPDAPVVFVGFSFGADLAPWIAGAGGWEKRLLGLVMIGPDETGSLEYRVRELLHFSPTSHIFSVADALDSAAGFPAALLHGGDDRVSAAPALAKRPGGLRKLVVVGEAGHHFRGHEPELRTALLDTMGWILGAARTKVPAGPAR